MDPLSAFAYAQLTDRHDGLASSALPRAPQVQEHAPGRTRRRLAASLQLAATRLDPSTRRVQVAHRQPAAVGG